MKAFSHVLIPLIILIYSCSNTVESEYSEFKLSDTITINYGQTLFNSQEDISIKFDSLLSDSRCPVNVVCVWEGDAEIKIHFIKKDESSNLFLHTNKNYPNSDTARFYYKVTLIDLLPYPHTEIEIDSTDYSAEIIVNKI